MSVCLYPFGLLYVLSVSSPYLFMFGDDRVMCYMGT